MINTAAHTNCITGVRLTLDTPRLLASIATLSSFVVSIELTADFSKDVFSSWPLEAYFSSNVEADAYATIFVSLSLSNFSVAEIPA